MDAWLNEFTSTTDRRGKRRCRIPPPGVSKAGGKSGIEWGGIVLNVEFLVLSVKFWVERKN